MKISSFFIVAFENMVQHKMRTALTLLGLIVGITSMLLMTGVGRGFERATQEGMASLLPTKLNIRQGYDPEGGPPQPLTVRDAALLREFVGRSAIHAVAPVKEIWGVEVRGLQADNFVNFVATSADYAITENLEFIQGRFFTADDELKKAPVIVVNQPFLDTLAANGQSDLSTVYIGSKRFTVVGVINESDFFGGFPKAIVPISLLGRDITSSSINWDNGVLIVETIDILAADIEQVEAAKLDAERMLRLGHDLNVEEKNDFFITDQREILDQINNFNRGFTLVLGGIGSISLIVGGIGIMNIMLATISERTREIGIRKAIGASDIDVLFQFLTEAVVVCITGGLLGIAFSYGLSLIANQLLGDVFGDAGIIIDFRSVLIATLFSIGAGILFGLYPALRAMRLDPIDALRSE